MKHLVKQLLISLALIVTPFAVASLPQIASADSTSTGSSGSGVNVFSNCGSTGASGSQICGASSDPNGFNKLMTNIINTMLIVLGMIAVVMIVIGGIRYVTSNGEAAQIKSAKDTILYSVVGLVVAIMSFAIVNFVLAAFKK